MELSHVTRPIKQLGRRVRHTSQRFRKRFGCKRYTAYMVGFHSIPSYYVKLANAQAELAGDPFAVVAIVRYRSKDTALEEQLIESCAKSNRHFSIERLTRNSLFIILSKRRNA